LPGRTIGGISEIEAVRKVSVFKEEEVENKEAYTDEGV